ncbi:MAG: YidC/Oxa1 family membrane protein insertase [Clostridiales bacterium]|jgi:YidC/Oxa1 family membrane protein insertase|nr:YidC/Oxa1 family membrane protein insertase [Clostridiales bacterium]
MGFINSVSNFIASNNIADGLKAPNGFPWQQIIMRGLDFVQNYGWRILLFAVLIKVALSPLDIYSRVKMRKNARITLSLQDKLSSLKKACGDDKMAYYQKEMQLKKQEGFSMFGFCLPMLVSLVLSIWVWQSVRAISEFKNMQQYLQWYDVYVQALQDKGFDKFTQNAEEQKIGQQAVVDFYAKNGNKDSFLTVKNIWIADVPWASSVNNSNDFKGRVGSYNNSSKIDGIDDGEFNDIIAQYDVVTLQLRDSKENSHNGFMILIVFSAGALLLSQILMQKLQRTGGMPTMAPTDNQFLQGMQTQMKMMVYIMPAIMGVFMVFQPAAFTLYMGVGSMTTLIINQVSTRILKMLDKQKEHNQLTKVQKYGRPDPKNIIDKEFDKD